MMQPILILHQIRFYKRFYSAIILYKLTEETPLPFVGGMMNITSGQMQQLQKEAVSSS
jgi:hypothetical protein